MITFSKFGNYGRLGNQLFQLASMIGISEHYGHELVLPSWKYADFFEYNVKKGNLKNPTILTEKSYSYNEFPDLKTPGEYDFLAYLQSEHYWFEHKEKVFQNLTFKKSFKDHVYKKYSNIILKNETKELIAISIRRGDYVNNACYEQLPIKYYILALEEQFPNWRTENHLVIFSDDMNYCKAHFECLENVSFAEYTYEDKSSYFGMNVSAIEQLCLMTYCDHFIIANSTFSWWGAYLGRKDRSKIIRPARIFDGPLKDTNIEDHYPQDWISFDAKDKKIPLKNVTFTIPVRYDHEDRSNNLALNVCILQQNFDTNIIVGEQGTLKFTEYKKYCTYLHYNNTVFHRTKMLNEMARTATTEIVVNWDADVFLAPMQILEAVEKLKTFDFVFPYDGRFARVPRTYFTAVEKGLDVGVLGGVKFGGMNKEDALSVGGAIFVRRQAFFEVGGENERFISYGPEDCERAFRFEQLGKLCRINGPIYHMDHFRGPNSTSQNKHFAENAIEWEKVRVMNKEELKEYVKTFKWIKNAN